MVVTTVPAPRNWMVPAVLSCLCCFWPTGIFAIMFASKVIFIQFSQIVTTHSILNNFYMTNIANRLRIIYWKPSLNSLSTKTSTVFRSAPINTFWRDSKKMCAYRVQYYFISFQYDNYNNIQIQRKNIYLPVNWKCTKYKRMT